MSDNKLKEIGLQDEDLVLISKLVEQKSGFLMWAEKALPYMDGTNANELYSFIQDAQIETNIKNIFQRLAIIEAKLDKLLQEDETHVDYPLHIIGEA
jgi:hypothetical protein